MIPKKTEFRNRKTNTENLENAGENKEKIKNFPCKVKACMVIY